MKAEQALAGLARTPRLLVALDFDGTLAPLVDEPMTARMVPEARTAVDALLSAPATTVAFVSGRTLHDLRIIAEHRDDSPVLLYASHGAEQWPGADGASEVPDAEDVLRDELSRRVADSVAGVPGVWLEPKRFGFAVHTRLAPESRAAEVDGAVDAVMARYAPHWRRRTGHDILEFSSRADGKDTAVARLRAQTGATAVLFAGDDVTDEDALQSLQPQDVGVRVGAGPSAATVRVPDIEELASLLLALAHERAAERE